MPPQMTLREASDPLSPELALVDPVMAEYARTWLPRPEDTLRRIDSLIEARRLAASRMAQPHAPAREPPTGSEPRHRGVLSRRDVRSTLLAAGVVAGILAAAILVGVRVDVGGNQAGADDTTIATRLTPTMPVIASPAQQAEGSRAGRTKGVGSSHNRRRQPRRFAWAPTPGASTYHVELFRHDARVFAADAKEPQIVIPSRWVFNRRRHELSAGEYRWFVWPVVSGLRASNATVQATLTISR